VQSVKITAGHRIGIWFPKPVVTKLQAVARREDVSISHIIRVLVRYALDHDVAAKDN
jgi:hypothetical protein